MPGMLTQALNMLKKLTIAPTLPNQYQSTEAKRLEVYDKLVELYARTGLFPREIRIEEQKISATSKLSLSELDQISELIKKDGQFMSWVRAIISEANPGVDVDAAINKMDFRKFVANHAMNFKHRDEFINALKGDNMLDVVRSNIVKPGA